MKTRVFLFISVFVYFILIFVINKFAFMIIYGDMTQDMTFEKMWEVIYHGLPLDLSMAGYLSVFPGIMVLLSIWLNPKVVSYITNIYYVIAFSLITFIGVTDILLYPYWGFHFDSTIFLYLKNPESALASASTLQIAIGFMTSIASIILFYLGYNFLIKKQILNLKVPKTIGKTSVTLLLLILLLFLPIRGGFSVSTMNIGKAYFSDDMFLNHAAINPQFNLMYSFFKSDDFASEYQFFDKNEALAIVDSLNYQPKYDSIPEHLTTPTPNIYLIILESFSSEALNDSLVAPNMHQFAKEGISFNNFYANTFRTDRGIVAIMSGYPSQPTTAIMKYPQKTQSLPTITKTLFKQGYNLSFYYGGDADFANMRSYIIGACATKDITSDKDFPVKDRLTKWGAPDNILFERILNDKNSQIQKKPFFKTILTLSSHEPFDIATQTIDHPYLNAVHFTDSCLGNFVNKLKSDSAEWKNTLVIMLPDHAMQSHPTGAANYDPRRYKIPMVWIGGAVKDTLQVNDFGSQNDLAATLLSQLNVKHNDFIFSKNMFNPLSKKFAFYSYVNGFSMIDSDGSVIYDNDKNGVLVKSGNDVEKEKKAKAYFQKMYLDIGGR